MDASVAIFALTRRGGGKGSRAIPKTGLPHTFRVLRRMGHPSQSIVKRVLSSSRHRSEPAVMRESVHLLKQRAFLRWIYFWKPSTTAAATLSPGSMGGRRTANGHASGLRMV